MEGVPRSSPSPSPPPSAPVAAIGSAGPKAAALRKVYSSALSSTLKANSYPNFASCFPTPAKYCPTALEGVWRQLNTRLEEECVKDFEKILAERNVVGSLNEWDQILHESRVRRDRSVNGQGQGQEKAMHLLTADELYQGATHAYLNRMASEVQTRLQETQKDNLNMMNDIKAQREEIERLVAGLEGSVRDLDGAVKALESGFDHEGVKKDIWDMEQEVRASR